MHRWAADPKNLILFTQRARPGTPAARLQAAPTPNELSVETKFNVALTGAELRRHQQEKNRRKNGGSGGTAEDGADASGSGGSSSAGGKGVDDDDDDDDEDFESFGGAMGSELLGPSSALTAAAQPPSNSNNNSTASQSTALASSAVPASASSSSSSSLTVAPSSASTSSASASASALVVLPARFGIAAAHPMFPSFEYKWTVDAFGAAIRAEDYTIAVADEQRPIGGLGAAGRQQQQQRAFVGLGMEGDAKAGGSAASTAASALAAAAAAEAEAAENETPVAVHSRVVQCAVRCAVRFIDFEGRSDGKGLKNLVQKIAPRKLILIRGADSDKELVRRHVTACKDVFVPRAGQTLDLTADLSVFSIRIKESLEQLLQFTDLPDNYQVAWFDGEIKFEGGAPTLVPARAPLPPPASSLSALSDQLAAILRIDREQKAARVEQKEAKRLSRAAKRQRTARRDGDSGSGSSSSGCGSSADDAMTVGHDDDAGDDDNQNASENEADDDNEDANDARDSIVHFGGAPPIAAGLPRAAAVLLSTTGTGAGAGGGASGSGGGGSVGGAAAGGAHAQLLLGDVRLAECKIALNQDAIAADFAQGTLVCGPGGSVHVRKHTATRMHLTGMLGEDFYRVRDLLYAQYEKL